MPAPVGSSVRLSVALSAVVEATRGLHSTLLPGVAASPLAFFGGTDTPARQVTGGDFIV